MKFKSFLLFCLLLPAITPRATAQTPVISGRVKDVKGAAIPSASIHIKGTSTGTKSDSAGFFSLHADPNTILIVSAIGYADTAINVANPTGITIVLTRQSKALEEVVVAHASENNEPQPTDETVREQMLANMMEDYIHGEGIGGGIRQFSGLQIGVKGGGDYHVVTTTSANTVNYGSLVPVYTHKEDTRGSRYLFDEWVKGLVVTPKDTVIRNPSYLFNYDKITGELLLTTDKRTMVTVDKQQVKAFALKGSDSAYIFEKVPSVNENDFIRLIAWGPRYKAYRTLKTKFVKADHVTNGYTESGNFYDEYVDGGVYYFVDMKTKSAHKFDLKKKSIMEALPQESAKAGSFISAHKYDTINEDFIRELITALNQ